MTIADIIPFSFPSKPIRLAQQQQKYLWNCYPFIKKWNITANYTYWSIANFSIRNVSWWKGETAFVITQILHLTWFS